MISNFTFKYPTTPLADQLHRLTIPLTILCGQSSDLSKTGLKSLARLICANRRVKIKVFPGAGHHVHVQKPYQVVWFILKSILQINLPKLDRQNFLPEEDHLGHLREPQSLISHNVYTENLVSDSRNAVCVSLILMVPLFAVIMYIIFYIMNILLQEFLSL